jgi:5-methylcytosine-specific restriction enzyme subunit McrC
VRIPIQNIYYLLCYAWDKLAEGKVVAIESIDSPNFADLFARVLISGTERLAKRGIDRTYVPQFEWISRIRGRVLFQDSIRSRALIGTQLPCEFDELSYDVIHNQIIKATARRLLRAEGVSSLHEEGLARICRMLQEIRDIELTTHAFSRVQLHRNNSFYDFLMKICELVHLNLAVSEQSGRTKFRDFVRDERQMGALFESFVRNFYRKHPPLPTVRREDIKWRWTPDDDLSAKLLPKMQTDICLISDTRKIIIDCKFTPDATRQNFEAEKLREAHLYQIHAYMSNLPDGPSNESCEMMLLYPQAERPIRASYRAGKRKVSIRTIDLGQTPPGIHNDLLELVL